MFQSDRRNCRGNERQKGAAYEYSIGVSDMLVYLYMDPGSCSAR